MNRVRSQSYSSRFSSGRVDILSWETVCSSSSSELIMQEGNIPKGGGPRGGGVFSHREQGKPIHAVKLIESNHCSGVGATTDLYQS